MATNNKKKDALTYALLETVRLVLEEQDSDVDSPVSGSFARRNSAISRRRAASQGSQDDSLGEEEGEETSSLEDDTSGSQQHTFARRNRQVVAKGSVPGGPCAHCGATESPQWRRPLTKKVVLCNACGIYYSRHHAMPKRKKATSTARRASTLPMELHATSMIDSDDGLVEVKQQPRHLNDTAMAAISSLLPNGGSVGASPANHHLKRSSMDLDHANGLHLAPEDCHHLAPRVVPRRNPWARVATLLHDDGGQRDSGGDGGTGEPSSIMSHSPDSVSPTGGVAGGGPARSGSSALPSGMTGGADGGDVEAGHHVSGGAGGGGRSSSAFAGDDFIARLQRPSKRSYSGVGAGQQQAGRLLPPASAQLLQRPASFAASRGRAQGIPISLAGRAQSEDPPDLAMMPALGTSWPPSSSMAADGALPLQALAGIPLKALSGHTVTGHPPSHASPAHPSSQSQVTCSQPPPPPPSPHALAITSSAEYSADSGSVRSSMVLVPICVTRGPPRGLLRQPPPPQPPPRSVVLQPSFQPLAANGGGHHP